MKAEDFLSDDFLKQFKTGEQLNDFLGKTQKRAIEKMLEGELDVHLGYGKNEQSDSSNARNGYGKKKIRTSFWEAEIKVPRDRGASFNPLSFARNLRQSFAFPRLSPSGKAWWKVLRR
ncbi:transposase [Chitinophaga rhizosphaerae]|uniref:transposase n=1 Tax=Chitinophaga rhizosphaerae TaxID=1864947 RepID=UPI001F0CA929|nr:transposase [Chitinophaga rhizosphaerae]